MKSKKALTFFTSLALMAFLALLAFFPASPTRAQLLGLPITLAQSTLGAAPASPQVLLNTMPFYARGWTTLTIHPVRPYKKLLLEVALPNTLPTSAHLHVVTTPIMPQARTVASATEETLGTGFGRWPSDPSTPLAITLVTDEWFRTPSSTSIVFENQVSAVSSPFQITDSARNVHWMESTGISLRVGTGVALKPSEYVGFPLDYYRGGSTQITDYESQVKANTMAVSHLWMHQPNHLSARGREASPGGTLTITLTMNPLWTGVRITFALYHQDGAGKDHTFWLSDPANLRSADQNDYPNDPFFLARPWSAAGAQPAWLSNWRFLKGDPFGRGGNFPWSVLAGPGGSQWMPYAPYDGGMILPWTSLLGEESSRWLLAWTTNICELNHWISFQSTSTNWGIQDPINSYSLPFFDKRLPYYWANSSYGDSRYALLPSHAFLAEWGHLAWAAFFQSAPFFPLKTPSHPLPKRWILPAHQANFYGRAGTCLLPPPPSGPDPLTSYKNDPVISQFGFWPQVWETDDRAPQFGSSCDITLNVGGSPILWQPTLPPLFNQWACWASPEWMSMMLYAHGLMWDATRGEPGTPFGTQELNDEFDPSIAPPQMDYLFQEWWAWFNRLPPHRWVEPQSEAMDINTVNSSLSTLYPSLTDLTNMMLTWTVSDTALGGDGGSRTLRGVFQGLKGAGLPTLSQPMFTLQSATCLIERVRVVGLPQ